MIGLAEIVLFLAPFAVFAAWRTLGPRIPQVSLPVALAIIGMLAASAAWFITRQRMAPRDVYVPAHLEGGEIIPGHAVPRAGR